MEKIVYEYCTLRYVPDIERGEFVNVGLMMMCKRFRWLKSEIKIDQGRILHFMPDSDINRLAKQLNVFVGNDVPDVSLPIEERYRWMAAVKSAIIQCSPSHPGIIILQDGDGRPEAEQLLIRKFYDLFNKLI